MKSGEFIIRPATIKDIPFLADTIIEAEKAGTDILSWSTIFGLTEAETRKYISVMLSEEVDGCELSVSSFLVAEINGQVVAALSAWIEGKNNESSIQLKGNLLSYVLPRDCIIRASAIYPVIQEVHIDYIPGSIQKGAGYIVRDFRNKNLFQILTNEIIERLLKSDPNIAQAYTQIYGCNIPAIKANEKIDFKIVMEKQSSNEEILRYLPSNRKLLLKREL
jgi:hypothetical protein